MRILLIVTLTAAALLLALQPTMGPAIAERSDQDAYVESGEASWYGPGFDGERTASGAAFDQTDLTAAHPDLPFGTTVTVTNMENGKQVNVEINDRGPYADDRIIDLSRAAARKLGILSDGTAEVRLEASVEPER